MKNLGIYANANPMTIEEHSLPWKYYPYFNQPCEDYDMTQSTEHSYWLIDL